MPIVAGSAVPETSVPNRLTAESFCAAAVAGLAVALCLPGAGLGLLAWAALAPLFVAATEVGFWRAAVLGYAAGFAFHGLAFYWIASAVRDAGIGPAGALAAWGLIVGAQALPWAAATAIGRWLDGRLPAGVKAFGWALAWTATAFACERWTGRVPADLLQYTQFRHLGLVQAAAWGGPHLLGFLIVLVNAAAAQVYLERRDGRRPVGSAVLAAAVVAAAGIWAQGSATLGARPKSGPSKKRIELLQPAIDPHEKWDVSFQARVLEQYKELLWARRTAMPDLVVWPEVALPGAAAEDEVPFPIKLGAARSAAAQLAGLLTEKPEIRRRYNTIISVGADGRLRGVYRKRRLVPIGETLPFEGRLRPSMGLLARLGGMTPGPEAQPLLATPLGLAGPSVCFELVYPGPARRDAARGASVLVNVSNDAWYGRTWGPAQHYHTAVFRAVENRITVVRAANAGISAVVDPWGVPLGRLGVNARGRLDVDVPAADPFPRRSLYARAGDWFGWLSLLGLAAVLALSFRRTSSARR